MNAFEPVCDAPCYAVVKCCRLIGLERPEDVRWERFKGARCLCGLRVRRLETYTFTVEGGPDLTYAVSQCGRCKTVWWRE